MAAVRLAVHLLGGGCGEDLPDNWQAADYLGPPGPAAEYGHCSRALANARDEAGPGTMKAGWMEFHNRLSLHHNVGVVPCSNSKGKRGGAGERMKVSEGGLQALAAAPCLGTVLQFREEALSKVVRSPSRSCRDI